VRGHCTATSCRTLAHAIRAPALAPPGRPTHGSGSEGGWTPLQQAVAKKQQKVLEGLAAERQSVERMDPSARFLPPLYTYATPGRCHVWRLVSAPPPCARYPDTGRGPPTRWRGSNKSRRTEGEALHGRRTQTAPVASVWEPPQ
jgi:hypothetical protein